MRKSAVLRMPSNGQLSYLSDKATALVEQERDVLALDGGRLREVPVGREVGLLVLVQVVVRVVRYDHDDEPVESDAFGVGEIRVESAQRGGKLEEKAVHFVVRIFVDVRRGHHFVDLHLYVELYIVVVVQALRVRQQRFRFGQTAVERNGIFFYGDGPANQPAGVEAFSVDLGSKTEP